MFAGENKTIILSQLNHTWIIDLDGTLVKHNGYKIDGYDTLLDGSRKFINEIPKDDMIVIITSRTRESAKQTKKFLCENNIRHDYIIFNAPYGERILINDCKPSGLSMALALNVFRDGGMNIKVNIDDAL